MKSGPWHLLRQFKTQQKTPDHILTNLGGTPSLRNKRYNLLGLQHGRASSVQPLLHSFYMTLMWLDFMRSLGASLKPWGLTLCYSNTLSEESVHPLQSATLGRRISEEHGVGGGQCGRESRWTRAANPVALNAENGNLWKKCLAPHK